MNQEYSKKKSPDNSSFSAGLGRLWLDKLHKVTGGEPKDREALLSILKEAQKRRLFDAEALSMIEGVLLVSEMQVRDIMIPRAQMVVVPRDASLQEILPVLSESAHSRFPVIGDSKDDVVGILLAKDLLPYFRENGDRSDSAFHSQDIMRMAVFIPESKRLNTLLKEFRANRNHMALVRDEYGGVSGLVTIEDVLEQIVGEIIDEHDIDEEAFILKHDEREYTLKALTPIDEFNEYFNVALDESQFDTLAGLVMLAFGHVPERGEVVQLEQFEFKVLNADSRRIYLLHMRIID